MLLLLCCCMCFWQCPGQPFVAACQPPKCFQVPYLFLVHEVMVTSQHCVTACREETSDEVAVLHFTYNKFDDLKSRRDRCDCAPTEDDAKRCFILPFDRMVRHLLHAWWSSNCRSIDHKFHLAGIRRNIFRAPVDMQRLIHPSVKSQPTRVELSLQGRMTLRLLRA
jgi:hypothetical protein